MPSSNRILILLLSSEVLVMSRSCQNAIPSPVINLAILRGKQMRNKPVGLWRVGLHHENTVVPRGIDHHHLTPLAAVITQAVIVQHVPIRSQPEYQSAVSHDRRTSMELPP